MAENGRGGSRTEPLDCVVIGGGPAGLAAANQLGRLSRTCVLVDDDRGRSLWSQTTRNYLGFPGGVRASELRLLGQRQAADHGVLLRSGHVTTLRRDRAGEGFRVEIEPPEDVPDPTAAEPGFEANRVRERELGRRIGERTTSKPSAIRARSVILATGVADRFPPFPGRDACVGISLFWCTVCDGFEARGRRVAIIGDDADALSTAFFLARVTDAATLITNHGRSRLPDERQHALERSGVRVIRARVEAYEHSDGQIGAVRLADGRTIAVDMVFVSAPKLPRTTLARRLGARRDVAGYLEVDDGMRTSVPGLYACGDILAGRPQQVAESVATGGVAATAASYDLMDPAAR